MPEVYPALTALNLHKIHRGESGFVHDALRNLVTAARSRPAAQAKFSTYRWEALETTATTKKLKDAIHATLGYTMRNSEAEIIMSRFRSQDNTFDYSAFILAFFHVYDGKSCAATTCNSTPRCTPKASPRYTAKVSPRGASRAVLRRAARRVSHLAGVTNYISNLGSAQMLNRALQMLEETLRIRIIRNLPDTTGEAGNIPRQKFQR